MPTLSSSNQWTLWPQIWLRSAGFPIEYVRKLEAPETVRLIVELFALEEQVVAANTRCIAELEELLKSLNDDRRIRRTYVKAVLNLKKGRSITAESVEQLALASDAVIALLRAQEAVEQKRAAITESRTNEMKAIELYLVEASKMPRFREALAWQNPSALRTGIDKLESKKSRKYRRLVANYLQRYCTKNDTIGFFGPVCWASITEDDAAGAAVPGETLITHREVTYSAWAIDALAQQLVAQFELKPLLAPRRMPSIRVDRGTIHLTGGKSADLEEDVAWILGHSDGEVRAVDLAQLAIADGRFEFETEADFYELLEELELAGLVLWRLEIPGLSLKPESILRGALESMGASAEPALEVLDILQEKRIRLGEAAGDEAATLVAIEDLAETFEKLSARGATRHAGITYGGRTIVHEDTVRNYELALPYSALAHIEDALALVLTSARWATAEIAKRYRTEFDRVFNSLAQDVVPYAEFHRGIVDLLPSTIGEGAGIVGEVLDELQDAWASLLERPVGSRALYFTSKELSEKVASRFDASAPGWPGARFHCPDFMVASADFPNSTARPLVVLGEIHVATLSISAPGITHEGAQVECPHLPEVRRAYEKRTPTSVMPVIPSQRATRATNRSLSSRDFEVEFGGSKSARPRDKVLASSELIVRRSPDGLVVESDAGGPVFDVIAFHEYILGNAMASRFRLMNNRKYTPRIVIDDLVIAREAWTFSAEEFAFHKERDEVKRFIDVRRWCRDNRLPRRVFAKASAERKPLYVDFESPDTLEILYNQMRKSTSVRFSELLPDTSELWLQDNEGERYTSELRCVVSDEIGLSTEP